MPDHAIEALADALRGRYVIERELGRGGMATVWLAHDLRHNRRVALKMLRPELALALGPERFLREIQVTAQLQHPHILPVFDSGEVAGQLWYIMPYIEGESLRVRLQREGQLPLEEALRLTREAAEALDYAHQQGIVHRDIKPENILLTRQGDPLVADFGIARALANTDDARLTETGLAVGTPAYMAPEQATGSGVDARADVYALGCVLYEMLAGEPPYTGPTAQAIIAKRLTEPVPHLSTLRQVPAGVEAAVRRALSRAPADRFGSATAFGRALLDTGEHAQPTARRIIRRRRAVAIALAVGLLVLGAFLIPRFAGRRAGSTTIAVLPVRDLTSGDSSAFAAGLTEDLGTAAAAVSGLFVVSSRSAAAAWRESDDPRILGQRLGVSTLLETTVRTSGDKLRLVARLIRARDGGVLWTSRYDRSKRDVIALQDELAGAVAEALRVRYAPKPPAPGDQPRLVDPRAYDLYARAVQLHQRQRSAGDLIAAAGLLDSALRVDSGFARAYGELAIVLLNELDFGVPHEKVWPVLGTVVRQGLSVDANEARTLSVAAALLSRDPQLRDSAHSLIRRAVSNSPGDAQVQTLSADLLTTWLRIPEARTQIQIALQLAPLDVFAIGTAAWHLIRLGEHQQAVAAVERAMALDPEITFQYTTRGMARACQGEWSLAFKDLKQGQGIGFFGLANLGVAHALHGDTAAALAIERQLRALAGRGQALPVSIAWIHAALGRVDSAFAWLQRAEAAGNPYTGIADFYFDGLAGDPRWLEWARRDVGDSVATAVRSTLLAHPRCRP